MRRKNERDDAPKGTPASVVFEGKTLRAKLGEPVMVALLAHGIDIASRSVKYHRPRGAFCMTGACGQCWMRVDDVPNRPSCRVPVRDGMVVERQNAFPSADHDLFRAADIAFASGFDHNRFGTTPVTAVNELIGATSRQMAGLGPISEKTPAPPPPITRVEAELCVIGGGPAGLAAASSSSRQAGVLLIEAREDTGGQLHTKLFPEHEGAAEEARQRIERVWTRSLVVAIYLEDGMRKILVRRGAGSPDEHLAIVTSRALVLANGGYELPDLFLRSDLPGHYGARALAELAFRHGVVPGSRAVVIDRGAEVGPRLAARLEGIGVPARVVSKVEAASGRKRVSGAEIADGDEVECDLIASALPVSPAFELAHQAGAEIEHRPAEGGFVVAVERATGATSVPGLFAAGDLTGATQVANAFAQGRAAGESAVRFLATGVR